MLSPLKDVLADVFPIVCVVAGSSLVVIVILAWLVREVAVRAIEKAAPDEVADVVNALTGLVGPFRWIWPWSVRTRTRWRQADDEASCDSSAGEKP